MFNKILKAAQGVAVAVPLALFFLSSPASAQTCAYNSTQGTCACPTSGAGTSCFGGQLFRSSDNSCQNDLRPCASNQNWSCTTESCVCNTASYPCGGCTAASSTVGATCSAPMNGRYTNVCGACACPSGTTICPSSNTCVTTLSCPAGTTFDPCTNTCGTPNVLLSPGWIQSGFIQVNGDVKSTGGNLRMDSATGGGQGDVYIANGKALRVDGSGVTTLSIGNWGVGGSSVNVFENGNHFAFGLSTIPGDNGVGNNTIETGNICLGNGINCRSTWPNTGDFDAAYVNVAGDTMTGDLNLTGATTDLFVAGKVGVGTTAPANKMDVAGSVAIGAAFAGTAAPANGLLVQGPTSIGPTGIMYSNQLLNVIAAGPTTNPLFTVRDNTAGVEMNFSRNTILQRGSNLVLDVYASEGDVDIRTSGTSKVYVQRDSAGGYVGVGTTTPATKLDVNGTVKMTGFLMPTAAGAGRFLMSDASGNGTWSTSAVITGSGTVNYVPKFTAASTLGDSQIFDNGTGVGIGTASPAAGVKLDVNGAVKGSTFTNSASPIVTGNLLIQPASGVAAMVVGTTNTTQFFQVQNNLGQAALNVDTTNMRVGIGTAAPNNKLHVPGLINFDDARLGTFLGYQAGNANTGNYNSFVGYQAGAQNTTGYQSAAFGYHAYYANTTGYNNTALGYAAMPANTSGISNTAVGMGTLASNTTGGYNTATGHAALTNNVSGQYNSAYGMQALVFSTADNNTAVGYRAAYSTSTGGGNTSVGTQAGDTVTTGTNNTFLGYGADASSASLTNATAVGANASVSASNAVVLGNNANVGIGTSSPAYKIDVESSGDAFKAGNASSWFRMWTGGNSRLSMGDGSAHEAGFIAAGQNGSSQNVIQVAACDDAGNCPTYTTFNQNGNVGVGVDNPGRKLDVAGDIGAQGQLYLSNGSPTEYFLDSDERSAMIHNNSNRLYVLRGCGTASGSWCQYNGQWPLWINLENNDANLGGNLNFGVANPTISASSYFVAPGGAYFNSGTVYTEAAIQARGGIHNDGAAALSIQGGTSGYTNFSGPIGVNGLTATSSYGIRAQGNYLGGYFTDTVYGGALYAGYYDYGLYAYGPSMAGYFYGGSSSKYTYIDYGHDGVYTNGWVSAHADNGYDIHMGGDAAGGDIEFGSATYGVHSVAMYNNADGGRMDLYAGNYYNYSSIRFKDHVETIDGALDTLQQLRGVTFRWKDDAPSADKGKEDVGLIAEEVAKVYPIAVHFGEDGKAEDLAYTKLIPLLVQSVNEQQKEIEDLKAQIQELKQAIGR